MTKVPSTKLYDALISVISRINSPEQRLLQGVVTLGIQPVIDYKNKDTDDGTRGTAARIIAAIGFVLSCLGQLFMIKTNKDIDKDKKKFLLPQEITDGVVNVGLGQVLKMLKEPELKD